MSAAKKKHRAVAEAAVAESVSPVSSPGVGVPWCRRIIIFVIALVWFGLFAPLGVDLHHDGVMMIPALRVAQGGMVFRDVFCQYGFLSPVLQALALKLGGGELLMMKYFSVLFYAGSAVMMDILWQDQLKQCWRNLLLLMMFALMPDTIVTFHPWSSIFALFFSLLSLWGQLKYLKSSKLHWLITSGACAGLTFLSRHPVGVVTLVAICATLFFEVMITETGWRQRLCKFLISTAAALGGFLLVVGTVAMILVASGAWDDFVYQCITSVFGFVHSRGDNGNWNYLAQSLFPFITDYGFFDSIFAILPLPALFWLLYGVRKGAHDRKMASEYLPLMAMVIFALGAWHQYYPVPCVRHLFWGGVPFMGIFVFTIYRLWNAAEKYRIQSRILVVVLMFIAFGCASLRLYGGYMRLAQLGRRQVSDIPGLKGVRLSRGEDYVLNGLRHQVEMLPPEIRTRGVLNYTQDGLWSVILPDCGFRHKQFLVVSSGLYPDYDAAVMEFIRARRPVVLSNEKMELEHYCERCAVQYMGQMYRLYVPLE